MVTLLIDQVLPSYDYAIVHASVFHTPPEASAQHASSTSATEPGCTAPPLHGSDPRRWAHARFNASRARCS